MVYIIFFCLTIPMLLMPPLLEIRSRCVVGFMLLGTVAALSAYEISTTVYPITGLSARSFSEPVPPVTEELLKAMPMFLYAILLDGRRNRVLPVATAVGVGFTILENSVILIDNVGLVTVLWATAGGFSASLMHGLCAAVAGIGITYVRKQKKLSYTGTFGLLSISITMHVLFNLLIQSDYDYIGMAMPLVLYGLIYWPYKRQRVHLPFQRARSTRPGESGCPGAGGIYREHGSILDEPTFVLDPAMAGEMLFVIRALVGEGFTMLIVTHEMKFVWDVSSRIFCMDQEGLYEDGPPEQTFGHPKKKRTRTFVKGFEVFEQEITSRRSDYIEINTAIEKFGRRQILSQRHINNIELVFEELCVQTLLGRMGDGIRLGFTVEASEADESCLVTVTYGDNAFNPFMDYADSLSMVLLSGMVRQYSYHSQNGNNQMDLYL